MAGSGQAEAGDGRGGGALGWPTELKRPFADGTTAIDLDPLSLLCRLASMVPPPRLHTVRYAGVLSSASRWRSLVIPLPQLPGFLRLRTLAIM